MSEMKTIPKYFAIFAFFFALSVINTYPLILNLGSGFLNYTRMPWQHDWWFNSWLIFHGIDIAKHLASGNFYYDAALYPYGVPIFLYIQALVASLAAYPLLSAFSLPVVMNVLTLLSLSAAGYTAFLLGTYVLKRTSYGLIAGAVFCSSPVMIAQAKSHLMVLTTVFAIPLYILFLLKTTEEPNSKNAIFLSLSAILLSMGYLYFLNMLFLFTVIYLTIKLLQRKVGLLQLRHYGMAFLLFLPFIAAVVFLFAKGSGMTLESPLAQVRSESVDLLAPFLPDISHPFFGSLVAGIRNRFVNNPILHSTYTGMTILILSLIGLIRNFRSARLWFLFALFFTLLSLGPVVHVAGKAVSFGLAPETSYMPYALYYRLFSPLVVSDCSMFFIPAMLFWAILAGFGIKACLAFSLTRHSPKTATALILCLIAFDFVSIPHPLLKIPDPGPFEAIRNSKKDISVLHLPYANDMMIYSYFQTLHGKSMLNTPCSRRIQDDLLHYGDNFPAFAKLKQIPGLSTQQFRPSDLQAASDFQNFFDLKFIVVHKTLLPKQEQAELLRHFIQQAFNAAPVFEDTSLLIFELPDPPQKSRDNTAPSTVDFDGMERNVLLTGWSFPEKDTSGRTFRWTNKKQSELIFKTSIPGKTQLVFTVLPFQPSKAPQQHLSISINGRFLEKRALQPGWQQYTITLPASCLQQGHNRLTFSFNYTLSPLKAGLSDDPRNLAAAFDSIHFLPVSHLAPVPHFFFGQSGR